MLDIHLHSDLQDVRRGLVVFQFAISIALIVLFIP